MAFVPIIMGSIKDLSWSQQVADELTRFGIDSEIRVASAHKAPLFLLDLLSRYENDGRPKVYVTVAGRSNALSALVDTNVTNPVIACPPYSDKYAGSDIFSSLRMPSGVAPAVVLDPKGAALVAAKILGMQFPAIKAKVSELHVSMESGVRSADGSLRD